MKIDKENTTSIKNNAAKIITNFFNDFLLIVIPQRARKARPYKLY